MPTRIIRDLLVATDELKALSSRTRRLRELQTLYLGSAPRELAASSRVKGCRAGTLFVWADNAAVAAKLKQLAPRLLAAICENEPEITQIRIEVQVGGRDRGGPYKSRKTPLTAATIERFDELARAMPEGELKSALARLAAHHAPGLDQNQALQHVKHHRD